MPKTSPLSAPNYANDRCPGREVLFPERGRRCCFGDPMDDDRRYMISLVIAWGAVLIALAFVFIWALR